MELFFVKALAALVLPPGVNIVLGIIGLALWRRARVVSAVLLAIAIVTLGLLSVPRVADLLYASVESFAPRPPGAAVAEGVGAIVVLAGGRMANAPEYGGETVSGYSLERLRYGARLSRETGLPLLLSGGRVYDEPASEASLMRDVLVDELGVPVRWLEETSRNTAENARYSAEILATENIAAIILVTHAAHMPRSVQAFESQGVQVYAAPTAYRSGNRPGAGLTDWLPSADALERSRAALHERLGSVWYNIRY